MNVLYDISVLGAGSVNAKARTGVFRVVENVARELIHQPDCKVTFCDSRNYLTTFNSLAYLADHPYFASVPFAKPSDFEKRIRPHRRRRLIAERFSKKLKLSFVENLQRKLLTRFLLTLEQMQRYDNRTITEKATNDTEIYHSPFYPIPEFISRKHNERTFLTCYDVIPVLYPHFVEQSIINLLNDILISLTPETWVLCISHATRNDLLNYMGNRLNPDRVIVTHLAASDVFYRSADSVLNRAVREKYRIPDAPYVLSVCTLEPRKNIDQVIRAFAKLVTQERIPDLNLVLVGTKGWMFDKIFQEIENVSSLKDRIFVTGFVADEDLSSLYSDALVFVYPSFYEGFGLPPLEAMKCGLPVITSNTSSLPEVVGDAGVMVAPSDLDQLCNELLRLYKNPSLRKSLGEKALMRSMQFSWKKCASDTVAAYRKALKA